MAVASVKDDFLYQIRKKRQEMVMLGLSKGFHHDDTINCSRQLDMMIYDIQKNKLMTKY